MVDGKAFKIDAQFFLPFIDATINTLKVQCFTDVVTRRPFFKGTQPQSVFDLAGVINITSNTFVGSITLCFSKDFFLDIMSKMLCETFTEINDDLQSGAGELLNIIFGAAKVVLNKKGYTIQKAIPTVIRGNAISTSHPKNHPVLVLPFQAGATEFYMEIYSDQGFRL